MTIKDYVRQDLYQDYHITRVEGCEIYPNGLGFEMERKHR